MACHRSSNCRSGIHYGGTLSENSGTLSATLLCTSLGIWYLCDRYRLVNWLWVGLPDIAGVLCGF